MQSVSGSSAAGATVAVVLAAGRGRRFGGTKQLVRLAGRPLVAHVVAAAHAGGVDDVVVVVGHDARQVAQAAGEEHAVHVARTPNVAAGQSASLLAGTALAADLGAGVVVVLLADQPDVGPDAVRAVTAAVCGGALAARVRYDDGPGHPVAFARRVLPRLAALRGDTGARGLLAGIGVVEVAQAGNAPVDLDTRWAWEATARQWEAEGGRVAPPAQRSPSCREQDGQARHP